MRATGIFFSASLLVLSDAFLIPQQPSVARRTQTGEPPGSTTYTHCSAVLF